MSEAQADWLETSVTAESFSMLQFVRTVRREGSIKIPPPPNLCVPCLLPLI